MGEQDKLQLEGIMSQGYGMIPKLVMTDPGLSVTAKAIYAYLCSLCGGGQTCFPSRGNITSVLNVNKDTYYVHFRQLQAAGLVRVTQQKAPSAQFAHNVFELCSDLPATVPDPAQSPDGLYSQVISPGIRRAGYGLLPKSVMLDPRLTATAKAIYAYICSFAGAGRTAFPRKATILYHLSLSPGTYTKAVAQLTQAGYLIINQRRERGRYTVYDYYLTDSVKFSDTVISDTEKSGTAEPDTVKPDTAPSDTVKPDRIINSPKNNNSIKNSSSNNSPSLSCNDWWAEAAGERDPQRLTELLSQIDRQTLTKYIRRHIGLDMIGVCDSEDHRRRIPYLIDLVAAALYRPTLTVSGISHPFSDFAPKLLALQLDEYQWALTKTDRVKGIRNLKAYYLACLYNAHEDMEAAFDQEVQADLQGLSF